MKSENRSLEGASKARALKMKLQGGAAARQDGRKTSPETVIPDFTAGFCSSRKRDSSCS